MSSDVVVPRWTLTSRPRLGRKVRLQWDEARGQSMLLYPEGVLVLNPTAQAVLELCDGTRDVSALVAALMSRFNGVAGRDVTDAPADTAAHATVITEAPEDRRRRIESDVLRFLERLDGRGWLVDEESLPSRVAPAVTEETRAG